MLQKNAMYVSEPAALPLRTPCPNCGCLWEAGTPVPNFCPSCGAAIRLAASALPAEAQDEHGMLGQAHVGDVIADRYRLIDVLGEGGMGAVYQAEHIRMGKALALKLLRGSFARQPAAIARFRSEAQIVSRLSNPHTIAVFDFGEVGPGGGFYLAMEYVPGRDLAAVLGELHGLPEARAAGIGEQILSSLAEAHDAGVTHRDIKPGNVMLMENRSGEDFVKVLDFGVAHLRDAPSSTGETSPNVIIGTPNYVSPEQVRGEPLDGRADLYSVGALLYELVSGRCPFVEANLMALLSAHLTRKPQPLRELVPGVSPAFAAVVHRALQKKPADRFKSADAMREALLSIAEPTAVPMRAISIPEMTNQGLRIANRRDFADLERQIRALKRGRVTGPAAVVALLLAAGLAAWRWAEVYDFIQDRLPRLAAALPASVRPADLYDGEEHEPNDTPAQANHIPIPPGPDGRRGGGIALMRGRIGARISEDTGDVDVYRIEVPRADRPLVLHAEWSGEKPGEGIRGLDVALTLNRGGDSSLGSASLEASVDRGGPGAPEEIVAPVAPGTYYLAVREKHPDGEPPVEKPTDRYTLRVWLAEPQPWEEIAPDSVGYLRKPHREWRTLAERNPIGKGAAIRGTTHAEDLDAYWVAPRGPADVPQVVAIVPEQRLGVDAWLWVPDPADRGRPRDRVRFEKAREGSPGEVVFVKLPASPGPDAPSLLLVGGVTGEGRYDIVALGPSGSSAPAVLRLLDVLEKDGRGPQALELAAGFAGLEPTSSARADVLLAGGKLADRMAVGGRPDLVKQCERASQLLGHQVFHVAGGRVRYLGAFEAAVGGEGGPAEEASFRLITRASTCGPTDVARRATLFLQRHPGSSFAAEARLWLARAEEDAYWRGGGTGALRRALDAYRAVAKGEGSAAGEAAKRLQALQTSQPHPPASSGIPCQ